MSLAWRRGVSSWDKGRAVTASYCDFSKACDTAPLHIQVGEAWTGEWGSCAMGLVFSRTNASILFCPLLGIDFSLFMLISPDFQSF